MNVGVLLRRVCASWFELHPWITRVLHCMACPHVASDSWSLTGPSGGFGENEGYFVRQGVLYFRKLRNKQVDDRSLGWTSSTFSESWKPAADARRTVKQPAERNAILSDLKSCARERDLQKGRRVHRNAVEAGIDTNSYVTAALVNMYAKCGSMVDARTVFDSIQQPDVVSWTTLISGYADHGQGFVALDLFSRMKEDRRCAPDPVIYLAVLKACASLAADGDETTKKACLERGRQLHLEAGSHMDLFVQNILIDMYAKCGSMAEARQVFDSMQEPDSVSWNALILGYAENGKGQVALDLFSRMKKGRRCVPDSVTYIALLKACTSLAADGDTTGCFERGREIHLEIGCHRGLFVQNMLIHMYSKCGRMGDARVVFDRIHEPNVVSWNTLILGYADNGQGLVALDLFTRMKTESKCAPDSVSYVAALKACSSTGALATGRRFHSEIREFDVHVVACLVDFYANCGSLEEAREVFDSHPRTRDVPTWNALLAGYSGFGDTSSVFVRFEAMQDQGFRANAVTFVCLLSCCSHAGLVEKARGYLEAMPGRYGVTPSLVHYTCMVDLLGRANKLDEALAVLQGMPCDADEVAWVTLLGACCKWKNSAVGNLAFESLLHLDKKNASAYVLMAEIYRRKGMSEEQERVLETREQSGARRSAGQAHVANASGGMVRFSIGEEHQDPPDVENKLKELLLSL